MLVPEDIEQIIIKSTCAESDKLKQRKFKIAEILDDVNYEDKQEREMVIASFVKSRMTNGKIK
jgi:hypothetical protein